MTSLQIYSCISWQTSLKFSYRHFSYITSKSNVALILTSRAYGPVLHPLSSFSRVTQALVACRLDSACQWRHAQGAMSLLSRDGSRSPQGPQRARSHCEACSQCRFEPARLCR